MLNERWVSAVHCLSSKLSLLHDPRPWSTSLNWLWLTLAAIAVHACDDPSLPHLRLKKTACYSSHNNTMGAHTLYGAFLEVFRWTLKSSIVMYRWRTSGWTLSFYDSAMLSFLLRYVTGRFFCDILCVTFLSWHNFPFLLPSFPSTPVTAKESITHTISLVPTDWAHAIYFLLFHSSFGCSDILYGYSPTKRIAICCATVNISLHLHRNFYDSQSQWIWK